MNRKQFLTFSSIAVLAQVAILFFLASISELPNVVLLTWSLRLLMLANTFWTIKLMVLRLDDIDSEHDRILVYVIFFVALLLTSGLSGILLYILPTNILTRSQS